MISVGEADDVSLVNEITVAIPRLVYNSFNRTEYMFKNLLIVILIFTGLGASVDSSFGQKFTLHLGKKNWITQLQFTKDSKYLIGAGISSTVGKWDVESRKEIWTLDLDANSRAGNKYTISEISDLDVSADGDLVAVSYRQSTVVGDTVQGEEIFPIALIDAKTGQILKKLLRRPTPKAAENVSFSPDATRLLSSVYSDNVAILWNVKTGNEELKVNLKSPGCSIKFTPSGQEFVTACGIEAYEKWNDPKKSDIRLYDLKTGDVVREFPRYYRNVTGIDFSEDGKYLILSTSAGIGLATIRTWDLQNNIKTLPENLLHQDEDTVQHQVLSSDRKLLAYATLDWRNGIVVARYIDGKGPNRVFKTVGDVVTLAFSPNSHYLAVGKRGGKILVFKL